jgi:hypothetical protein
MFGWLVYERGIEPHVTVFDKSIRQDGTFSRDDFTYDHIGDVYSCPAGKMLTTTGSRVDGATLRYRASKYDCLPLKATMLSKGACHRHKRPLRCTLQRVRFLWPRRRASAKGTFDLNEIEWLQETAHTIFRSINSNIDGLFAINIF